MLQAIRHVAAERFGQQGQRVPVCVAAEDNLLVLLDEHQRCTGRRQGAAQRGLQQVKAGEDDAGA